MSIKILQNRLTCLTTDRKNNIQDKNGKGTGQH